MENLLLRWPVTPSSEHMKKESGEANASLLSSFNIIAEHHPPLYVIAGEIMLKEAHGLFWYC